MPVPSVSPYPCNDAVHEDAHNADASCIQRQRAEEVLPLTDEAVGGIWHLQMKGGAGRFGLSDIGLSEKILMNRAWACVFGGRTGNTRLGRVGAGWRGRCMSDTDATLWQCLGGVPSCAEDSRGDTPTAAAQRRALSSTVHHAMHRHWLLNIRKVSAAHMPAHSPAPWLSQPGPCSTHVQPPTTQAAGLPPAQPPSWPAWPTTRRVAAMMCALPWPQQRTAMLAADHCSCSPGVREIATAWCRIVMARHGELSERNVCEGSVGPVLWLN